MSNVALLRPCYLHVLVLLYVLIIIAGYNDDDDDVSHVNVNFDQECGYMEMNQVKVEDIEMDPFAQINLVNKRRSRRVNDRSIKIDTPTTSTSYSEGRKSSSSIVVAPTDISYTQSSRGTPQIIIHGYTYFKNNVPASCSSTYWNCVDMVRLKCPARVILKSEGKGGVIRKAHSRSPSASARLTATERAVDPTDVHHTQSKRGLPQIIVHGYTYSKNNVPNATTTTTTSYWNCVYMTKLKCPAKVILKAVEGGGGSVRNEHNHGPSEPIMT